MSPRVVFLGMGGALTNAAFWSLRQAGIDIAAVVKPFPFETEWQGTELYRKDWFKKSRFEGAYLDALSMRYIIPGLRIPLLEATNANLPKVLDFIRSFSPELICVASYTHIFKEELLSIPVKGCINMHPSALPLYRGPNPFFWMFKDFVKEAGVTIHFLNRGIDTGEIIYQEKIVIEEGLRGVELNRRLAALGGPLMARAALDVLNDRVVSTPQKLEEGSYQTRPSDEDTLLDTDLSARHIYHFVRGVARWIPLFHEHEGKRYTIKDGVGYKLGTFASSPCIEHDGEITINCCDGQVRLKATSN